MKIRAYAKCASVLSLVAVSSCSQQTTPVKEAPAAVRTETAANTPAESEPEAPPSDDPAGNAALLRAYGSFDMTLQKCVKREKDGSILGENCPPGLLVFGPYVRIPKGATLHLTFDVQSEKKLKIVSDVVSSGGQIFHGSMDEQEVDPKVARRMGYGIHMFQDVNAAEARIWVKAEGPTNFKITNLKLVVL